MKWFHRLKVVPWRFPLMLTLSMLPGPDVAASVSLALGAFRKLRRCYGFSRWVYAVEVKPNPAGWYVHVHALVDCGRWLDMAHLSEEWRKLTGAYIVDVRRVDRHRSRGAVLEVVKYVTKGFGDLAPCDVDALDAATRSRRMVAASGGLVFSLLDTQETSLRIGSSESSKSRILNPNVRGTESAYRGGLVCPACGSALQFVCILPVEAFCDLPVYVYPVEGARAGPGG